jgi:hypothetical protein
MSRPPRRPFVHARRRPWVAVRVNDSYIALNTTVEPIVEACLVPLNGDVLQAEHTAALIEFWSAQDAAGRSVRS